MEIEEKDNSNNSIASAGVEPTAQGGDDTDKNTRNNQTLENMENPEARQSENGEDLEDGQPTITKSQLKKLKKKEKWEQVKAQKRKAEKDRQKARKRACIERGEEIGPSRKQLRKNKMSMSSCKVQVVVDCDFDQYMADKDIKMLVKQIQFSYSANRRVENPLQFHCCGISGKTKARLESLGDYKGWDIRFHHESYLDLYDKGSIVYLSSESPNILTTLEEDKVYIIGGLVDHNHHKGLCHRLAEEKGVAHAQLPISDYIDMKTRKVLTINHVFEILLYYTETKDWQKSFYRVLPPRKGAIMKSDISTDKNDSETKGDNSVQDSLKGEKSEEESLKGENSESQTDSPKSNSNSAGVCGASVDNTGDSVSGITSERDQTDCIDNSCKSDKEITENVEQTEKEKQESQVLSENLSKESENVTCTEPVQS